MIWQSLIYAIGVLAIGFLMLCAMFHYLERPAKKPVVFVRRHENLLSSAFIVLAIVRAERRKHHNVTRRWPLRNILRGDKINERGELP